MDLLLVDSKHLSMLSSFINFLGTIFLAKGLLLTDRQIKKLAKTFYGKNLNLEKSLKNNRLWALFGLSFIILSNLLQLIALSK